jgi:hypothetical protein
MSYLSHCLELLGFTNIDDINANSLKRAFKQKVLIAHPDKGGNQEDFDCVLSAYIFLLNLEKRIYGGRNEIITEITPEELKENRIDEIIDKIFEEFQLEKFNAEFETNHQKVIHGYQTWLNNTSEENNLINGKFGSATQKQPEFNEKDFDKIFLQRVKDGKPEPTAIILHPEAMAYVSGSDIGTSIIEKNTGSYSSDLYQTPEFCDVFSAFNTENTVSDKIPSFIELNKTLESILEEREAEIKHFDDSELTAIKEFEKLKLETNKNNLSNIRNYFENKDNGNNNLVSHSMENWPPEKYKDSEYKGFRLDF